MRQSVVRSVEPTGVRPEAKPTPEMAEAVRMREALDSGDVHQALALARGLVDAKDQKVRLQAIEVMEWIGQAAFPELIELANDEDEVVAEAALQAWEKVLDGVTNQNLRLTIIMKTARSLSRANLIDAVFLKLVDCDQIAALVELAKFIETTRGSVANRCAQEMYGHIASEPWESVGRTDTLIRELKEKEGKQ